jgi:hypothetical protein
VAGAGAAAGVAGVTGAAAAGLAGSAFLVSVAGTVVAPVSETPLCFTFSSVASPIPLTFFRSSIDLKGPLALR